MFKEKQSVWFVVLLIGVYVALQMIADVTATKIVEVAGITFPAGTFVFALTFTWRDLLHKRLGREYARATIVVAGLVNVLMAGYFMFAVELPPAVFWQGQTAFAQTLAVVPQITIASIVAEVVSQLLDTEIYDVAIKYISSKHQWARVLLSNAISLPVDSLIFAVLAFAGIMPISAMLDVALGQVVFKALITVISLPLIYLIPDKQQQFGPAD